MHCTSHHSYFTIYPPGYGPHQRQRLVKTSYGTSEVRRGGQLRESFEKSLFEAAIDGSEGKAWSREWMEAPRQWWETQRRRIGRAQALLGLVPKITQTDGLEVAGLLDVDYLLLAEARKKISEKPGYRSRGQAVRLVLGELMNRGSPHDRLLLAGQRAGLWGRPLWWDAESGIIRGIPFRIAGLE